MKSTSQTAADDLPEAILAQAAIWHARLRDAGLTASQAGVRTGEDDPALATTSNQARQTIEDYLAWLGADPRHQRASEEMASVWAALEIPITQALEKTVPQQPAKSARSRPSRHPFLFGAAMRGCVLAACLILAIGWHMDWLIRWQSDYTSPVGERTPLQMEDGSRIVLNTASALSVDYDAQTRRVRLLKGEAWFDVDSGDARPFIVTAGAGEIRVTGTRFNVELRDDKTIVSLDKGAVELRRLGASDSPPRILAPGQQAEISGQGIISAPVAFNRTTIHAWQRGQFVFYDTPLADVVDALNRYRDGHIFILDSSLAALRVSGVFSTTDPDAALNIITRTLPVRQSRVTDSLVLLH